MLLQLQVWAFFLLQEGGAVGWDVRSMWAQMGPLAKAVVIGLFVMSAWSIGVMIDRLMAYNAARKQSRQFAPAVAGALREGKLDEAIKIADRYKKSHLAKVVVAGLQESGLGAVAGGISEALVTTAIGLFVAIPAVWMFNYFNNKIEAFDVEMGNSSSELIDYFLKRSQRGAGARK
ncbi:MAG: MotA/TolQ/ExbB proton channel family protein [Bryobacteraceae bacterium]